MTTDVTLDGNVFHLVRGFIYSPGSSDGRLLHLTATNNELTNVQVWAFNLAGVPDATLVNNTVWNAGHGVQLRGANTRVALYDNIVSVLDRATGTVTGEDYNLIATGPEIGSHDLRATPCS